MKFKQQSMVNWYDVRQLIATGIKTVISSVFGNFADKRETQSVLSDDESFDHSGHKEIWIDFIADLGDGFNSTYSMASLLAAKELTVDSNPISENGKITLERGQILIMGGDQVYPTPEKEEYRNRLQGPYQAAFPENKTDPNRPRLFALPGNHDWYDGLTNFIKLFCQNRSLGNWATCQKRSYFAIKLPHNYWIWGIDVQLNADIDLPQQQYFKRVAKNEASAINKIILCTAEPAWVMNSLDKKDLSYSRLRFFIGECVPKNFEVAAILTGDLHHYSRYEMLGSDTEKRLQLVTAGGGGAFLHPTHILKDRIQLEDGNRFELKKVFPSKSKSSALAFGNLTFPVLSWGMALFMGIFHVITSWFLQSAPKTSAGTFLEEIQFLEFTGAGLKEYFFILRSSLFHNPAVVLLNLVLFIGIVKFTDIDTGKRKLNYIAGIFHAVLQVVNFYFFLLLFAGINLHELGLGINSWKQILLFLTEMIVVGGFSSGILFGLYLLISTLFLGSHATEAFSSLRITGYKNFLRMRLTKDGVTLYPIGVKKIVTNWKNTGTVNNPKFTGSQVKYSLIEDPITIK